MSNQNITIFTSNFIYFTKISGLEKKYQNCSLNAFASDEQGKSIGPTSKQPISELLPEGFTPKIGENDLKVFKDSSSSFVKILLVKGSTEIGSSLFSIAKFEFDQLSPLNLNLTNKGKIVGKINLNFHKTGSIFEKEIFYKIAMVHQKNLMQIQFTKTLKKNLLNLEVDETLLKNSIMSIISKIIEFTNTKSDVFDIVDLSTVYPTDTPITITMIIRFKDEFLDEAIEYVEKNESFNKISFEEPITFQCNLDVSEFSSKIDPIGLQAKFYFSKNIKQSFMNPFSLSFKFHEQNEMNAIKFDFLKILIFFSFVEMNKDQIKVISKDKGIKYASAKSTIYPYFSCYIVWFYLIDPKNFNEIVEMKK
jgi:hypothetical protein